MSAAQDAVVDRVRTEGGIMILRLVCYACVKCPRFSCESKYKRCHCCLLACFRCKKIRRSNINGDVPKSNHVGKDLDTIEYSYEHPVVADSTEQVIVIVEVHL